MRSPFSRGHGANPDPTSRFEEALNGMGFEFGLRLCRPGTVKDQSFVDHQPILEVGQWLIEMLIQGGAKQYAILYQHPVLEGVQCRHVMACLFQLCLMLGSLI